MQKVKFLYFFTIIALLNTLAHASGYQNITAGYIFENASVTHPKIDHTDNVTNYAVNLMYTKMHPLFFLRGRVILHPDQYLSKGYSQGNRYTARLNMLDLDFTWGAKYLFSRKFYFIPAISIRYKSATTRFKNIDNKITWFAATSYDSALVAIEAMRKAGISGEATQVEQDRQLLRDYLDSVNQKDEGFEGITGKIYFDENHNFTQPLAMGLFDNDKFISAPVQLYSIEKEDLPDDYGKKIASGHIIRQNGQYFGKTRIVYVGVDINEFDDIDVDGEHTYFVDFYLWFRYKGEKLDFSEVKFDNSVKDLSLDSPLEEKEFGDTHYILFKVRETFRNSFDLSDYPFDHQRLPIKLRHSSLERKNLIFVTDILGLGPITEDNIKNTLKRSDAFETTTDWNVVTGFFFSDSVHDFGTRGDPTQFDKKSEIEHSRFTAAIEVKRDVIGFTSKTMMPVFWIILLAYLGLFLPGREFDTITGLMTGTVLSVVFFHVGLAGRLNVGYTVALDYAFYIIYALLATELFLSIVAWHRSVKNKDDNAIKAIFWLMRFLYPAVIIGMVIYAIIHYKVIL